MIRIFKTEDGAVHQQDETSTGCWVALTDPTATEILEIADQYHIDPDDLRAPLDEEERSRIEVEDNYTLILVDIPTIEDRNEKDWYVTIPMLSGTTFFIVITSIINSFKVFGLINLMTHGGPGTATTMLVYNIYRTAFQFGKLEFASAQGIVLLAIIFFITWIQFRIQKRNEA